MDLSKAHEIIFSRRRSTAYHPRLTFNNIPVAQTNTQKHWGMQLDKKLYFEEHLSKVESNVNKTVRIFHKLQNILPWSALLTIYKMIIRLRQDFGDMTYDKAFKESFHAKQGCLQYNITLVITVSIRRSSTEKIFEEFDLESLKLRRWYKNMRFLYKVLKRESPSYLFNTIPNSNTQRQTRNSANTASFFVKHDCFKNSVFFFSNNWVE